MNIQSVIFTPGYSAFFFDDQGAIKLGADHDGFLYRGKPVTPGFSTIRQAGESISVQILLENGLVGVGDCAAVQYSGAGGRDPLFLAQSYIPFLQKHIAPILVGQSVSQFLPLSRRIEELQIEGKKIHTALRYGLTQALLHASALAQSLTMTEVLCREYGLPVVLEPIPLFGQSGDDRYTAVDKMILKKVDVLPHGLINNVETKLGSRGEKLAEYIRWLRDRIQSLRTDKTYLPDLHLDLYGTPGLIFDQDPFKVAEYLASLEADAYPHRLYIEGPVDLGSKDRQIEALGTITQTLGSLGSGVKIVADEWCNTLQDVQDFVDARCCSMVQIKTPDLGGIHTIVEAVLYSKQGGVEAYQGGTCNETDISARVSVHLALATRPERMLVKPGMGFDEGLVIVSNEMTRTLGLLKTRKEAKG